MYWLETGETTPELDYPDAGEIRHSQQYLNGILLFYIPTWQPSESVSFSNYVRLNNKYSFSLFDVTGKIVFRMENSNYMDVTNLQKVCTFYVLDEGEEIKFVKM